MNREELEANWGWDAQQGSIPFKRPRITDKNIEDQRQLARPGTLIHWAGNLVYPDIPEGNVNVPAPIPGGKCSRLDAGVDMSPVIGSKTGETHYKAASQIANVNCLQCRRVYFSDKSRPTY